MKQNLYKIIRNTGIALTIAGFSWTYYQLGRVDKAEPKELTRKELNKCFYGILGSCAVGTATTFFWRKSNKLEKETENKI